MTNVIPIASISQAFQNAEPAGKQWPDPVPLPVTLLPVPPMEPDMLPLKFRSWQADIAERMNVPLDFPAVAGLVAASSLVGAKVCVRPEANSKWEEAGNLWGLICAPPGMKKSPAIAQVLEPLRKLETRANKAYQSELSYFQDSMKVFKLQLDEAEKEAKKAVKDGNILGAQQIIEQCREPQAPPQKRFIVNNSTVEALGVICEANPQGLLVHRDELVTLFSDLAAPENATARDFYMQGWGGLSGYTFDRIIRGTTIIPRINLAMLGTTQPSRLSGFIRESLSKLDDGFCQRSQVLTWPDISTDWKYVDRHPDLSARQSAFQCFDLLADLNAAHLGAMRDDWDDEEAIPYLRLSPPALEMFNDYRAYIEPLALRGELGSGLSSHLAKFAGMTARIALVCHLCNGGSGPVSAEAMEMALAWGRYLKAHAERAYGSTTVDDSEAARSIWKRIEKRELPMTFGERDIYRNNWAGLKKGARLSGGLALLVDSDWLGAEKTVAGGRSTSVYTVNPKALNRQLLAA
jgi:hypothetical protein